MGAQAISNSYGGSDTGTTSVETHYNHPGHAIAASSGDSGFGVQFPASSPHVTAVGGTTLNHSTNAAAGPSRPGRVRAAAARGSTPSRPGSSTPAARGAPSPT
jgi:hypothetical protein